MDRRLFATVLLAAVVGTSACDNEIENATTPGEPAPTTTDTFTGRLNVNGAQTHTFPVAASGLVTVTLTELTPDPDTTIVGVTLGTWNGQACTAVISNDNAKRTHAVIGNATGSGILCARIHDVGKLTAPTDYKLEVVHP